MRHRAALPKAQAVLCVYAALAACGGEPAPDKAAIGETEASLQQLWTYDGPLQLAVGRRVAVNAPLLRVGNLQPHAQAPAMFNFVAKAGKTYTVRTHLGSLADTVLTLLGSDAKSELAFNDDAAGTLASAITWTAASDGIHHFAVRSYAPHQSGRFAVQVFRHGSLLAGAEDDCFAGVGVACPVQGKVASPGDAGWHAFVASPSGKRHIVTALGSLADSTVTVYDSDASTPLAFNDDLRQALPAKADPELFGGGYMLSPRASALTFSVNPSASPKKVYFIKVAGYSPNDSGDYALWVQDPNALPTDLIGCLFGPVACAASIAFSIVTFWTASSAY